MFLAVVDCIRVNLGEAGVVRFEPERALEEPLRRFGPGVDGVESRHPRPRFRDARVLVDSLLETVGRLEQMRLAKQDASLRRHHMRVIAEAISRP